MDIGGPQIGLNASPRLSEHAEEDDVADASTKSATSTEETVHSAVAQTGQPDSTSESEKEGADTNTEEDFELNRENLSVKDNSSDQSSTGPDVGEDTKVDKISDFKEEITNKDKMTDPDINTQEEKGSLTSKLMVSTADDLDEMMDIGTVDQVEQEAQMKEEEHNSLMDVDHSHSPIISNTVAMDADSIKEEMDVKPTGLPPPADEGRDEDVKVALDLMQSNSSPSTEAMTAGKGSSSPANVMNGMNVVKPDTESSELKSSAPPLLVKVKEEPADDEYEQAQISCSSTANVKDEPNTAKDDLRIGSVYSVTPAAEQSLPVINPPSLHMSCSHCKKSLTKGQTAFQRKGSSALFCSTACLTTSLPPIKGPAKVCHNCQKMVVRPQDIILGPDAKGAVKGFCSQNCLTSFNLKKNSIIKAPQPTAPQSLCSMCARYGISKHEVILNSSVHKLCSDACFKRFRSVNNLSMAGCANCEAFCHVKPLMLKVEGGSKPVCNAECLAKYKEKTKTAEPCRMCHTTRLLAEMIDNRNSDDTVNLFCSSSCVMAFKVQTVSASGSRINCDSCGKNMVPAYHLAMSDTSIRNFCALPCVMSFQDKFKNSQKQVDIFTRLPVGSTQIQGIAPAQPPRDMSKAQILSCSQCNISITFKPLLIQIKDKMAFVCSADCSYEFKKANSITSLCVNCKVDRIAKDAKRIENKDCFFCSDGCRLIFRHDMTKFWGKHCSSCAYCHSVSKRLVTAQYGGSTEEFCSEECRSKYTMLFCHVAKCDACGRKGKLRQSLPLLGDVRNFCDLTCLLQFCCDKVATQGDVFKDAGDATPVIANVVSLAGSKSNATDGSAQQSTVSDCQSKSSGTIGTQTDPVKTAPPSVQKVLKNKALLCRPLVQNKGISCRTQTVDCEAQTDDSFPKVMVVPVPVPVYVPVPMNMYTQFTPNPMGLPVPLPVPMFLPVTMDSAERIVETIQEIKEKIPSDPFEAELILMAEMVAEQDETNHKEERPKQKEVEKERGRQGASAPDDHASNYSDDLDTDDLASFLNNWEDASSYAGLRSPSRQSSQEKLNPSPDSPVASSSEYSSEALPAAQPPMDIEADISVETLERLARLREKSQRSPSPPPAAQRRRQTQRKAREKRVAGHKSQRLSKAGKGSQPQSPSNATVLEIPKLKSQYGVDAWKRWILWRRTQHDVEKPRFARSMEMKEDVLRCTTAELSYGLCCFINEVKRPNGEPYSPDSLFYLCLGIQQHLFENGRVENIFMDRFYSKFSTEFTTMLRGFKPSVTAGGYIHSRVEEEFLWDCKQLGAYSPIVLLNTLLFFCCKYFGFTAVEQHRQLSFAHVMRCTKTNQDHSKNVFLRFYPPISINEPESGPEAKRRKEEENKEDVLEMMENTENPLRCPVRLYEFYLSKCSESVKQRTNVFYLHPERCCVPNSPLWFSSSPLDDSTIEAMLTRILTVRELHTKTRKEERMEQENAHDPSYTPDDENSE